MPYQLKKNPDLSAHKRKVTRAKEDSQNWEI